MSDREGKRTVSILATGSGRLGVVLGSVDAGSKRSMPTTRAAVSTAAVDVSVVRRIVGGTPDCDRATTVRGGGLHTLSAVHTWEERRDSVRQHLVRLLRAATPVDGATGVESGTRSGVSACAAAPQVFSSVGLRRDRKR
jgi:hypothetical protein